MARIEMLPLDEGQLEETEGNLVNQDVARILKHQPEMAAALWGVINATYEYGTLSKRLKELVRIRIAFHNQCRSCMAIRFDSAVDLGVDDDLVCSLEKPAEAPDLTDAERAALRFADLFATNHLAIDDAVYDDLRQYYTEKELVELGLHCALCVGGGRMAATWNVTEHVPEHLKGDGVVGPWGGEQLRVRETTETHLLDA